MKQELIKNFDYDFGKFKELRYLTDRQVEQYVDEFYRLSILQLGYPDRRYVRIHAYNYCVAPWCGDLPERLDDPARKYWVYYYHRALKMFFCSIEGRFNFNNGGF